MGRRLPFRATTLLLATAFFLGAAPDARAQDGAVPPAIGLPGTSEFIPLAEEAELRAEANAARALELETKDALVVQRDLEGDAKSRLSARKAILDALKKQIDLASKDKREADKKSLEAERKNEEAARNFFERLLALREAESEYLSVMMETHRSRAIACDRGLELVARRQKTSETKSVTSSAQLSSLDSNLASAEKQYLEATRTWMERASNAADKNKTVAERRLQTWETLRIVRR